MRQKVAGDNGLQRPRSSEEMETGKSDEGLVESPKEINTYCTRTS